MIEAGVGDKPIEAFRQGPVQPIFRLAAPRHFRQDGRLGGQDAAYREQAHLPQPLLRQVGQHGRHKGSE